MTADAPAATAASMKRAPSVLAPAMAMKQIAGFHLPAVRRHAGDLQRGETRIAGGTGRKKFGELHACSVMLRARG